MKDRILTFLYLTLRYIRDKLTSYPTVFGRNDAVRILRENAIKNGLIKEFNFDKQIKPKKIKYNGE